MSSVLAGFMWDEDNGTINYQQSTINENASEVKMVMLDSGAMAPFRFRQFKVYHDAKKFRSYCLKLLEKLKAKHAYYLVDQIRRASLSIVLNIAEGSSKRSDIDFARFLETSTGSVNEVVAGFDMACDEGLITQDEYSIIEKEGEEILNQLGGFIKNLRNKKS